MKLQVRVGVLILRLEHVGSEGTTQLVGRCVFFQVKLASLQILFLHMFSLQEQEDDVAVDASSLGWRWWGVGCRLKKK